MGQLLRISLKYNYITKIVKKNNGAKIQASPPLTVFFSPIHP